jgi:Alpha/beta hydrolase domain
MTALLSIPHGAGVPQASARAASSPQEQNAVPLAHDYEEIEYLLSGNARTFTGAITGPVMEASSGHRYQTRVLVRYPADPSRFSGRVVVEPFNTSAGHDRDALWSHVGTLLQAQGDAWVGVTDRAAGAVALKEYDPVRYAKIDFSSNDFAWDVLAQIGRLLKAGGEQSPLDRLALRHVYLGGYSQSGCDVATFAMAFSRTTRTADGSAVYDGYFPAAHSASFTPVATGNSPLPIFEYVTAGPAEGPVVQIESQSDVEGFSAEIGPDFVFTSPGGASVRRDDSDLADDRYRLYEVAGAPHHAPPDECDGESTFPFDAFVRAALTGLFGWAEDATPPPLAPRITIAEIDAVSAADVDDHGNALGGVRSPFLDVPLACFEVHSTPGPMCKLAGRETVLPVSVLATRYGSVRNYLDEFSASLDTTIRAGFLLEADRAAITTAAEVKAHQAFSSIGGTPTVPPMTARVPVA